MDEAARRRLLAWYHAQRRDLPWRRTKDPYAILVSEVMLQQTRVEVAAPYYTRWMRRFPTLGALAAASEEDVLAAWAGLGYYRRARSLHAAAKAAAAAGGLPRSMEGLLELPGVGPYTAGAVASIAFGQRMPCVDGNVTRVAARHLGWREPDSPALRRRVAQEAAAWVPARLPGDWNQALMELGATVCTPRLPRCGECPLRASCASPDPTFLPAVSASRPRRERLHFALVRRKGRVLLVRNPPTGLLAGLWMLPGGPAAVPLARLVREQAGLRVRAGPAGQPVRHDFSHRAWSMALRRADVVGTGTASPEPAQCETWWCPEEKVASAAIPAAMRRLLAQGQGPGGEESRPIKPLPVP